MSITSKTPEVWKSCSWLSTNYSVCVKGIKWTQTLEWIELFSEEGFLGLTKGWEATLIGYSLQGFGKFAFYEIFKRFYGEILGEENAYLYRTTVYLISSASAEFLADVALTPWEATKVRIQTQDNWAKSLREGLPKFYGNEELWFFWNWICIV